MVPTVPTVMSALQGLTSVTAWPIALIQLVALTVNVMPDMKVTDSPEVVTT